LLTFSIPCAGAPPDFHSFPTRRSSDLSRVSQRDELVVCVLLPGCSAPARANSVSIPAVRNRRDAARTRGLKKADSEMEFFFIDRSEEHTSELQSRGHLVCRLLLEKKKK